jgi:hypothetical protein
MQLAGLGAGPGYQRAWGRQEEEGAPRGGPRGAKLLAAPRAPLSGPPCAACGPDPVVAAQAADSASSRSSSRLLNFEGMQNCVLVAI